MGVDIERLSRYIYIYIFPLQLLLNHHGIDTYNSLGCCRNDSLATSWCQRACVCSRAVSEVDHLPIILISTGHTSLGDFREWVWRSGFQLQTPVSLLPITCHLPTTNGGWWLLATRAAVVPILSTPGCRVLLQLLLLSESIRNNQLQCFRGSDPLRWWRLSSWFFPSCRYIYCNNFCHSHHPGLLRHGGLSPCCDYRSSLAQGFWALLRNLKPTGFQRLGWYCMRDCLGSCVNILSVPESESKNWAWATQIQVLSIKKS